MLTAAQIEALRAKSEKLVDPITEFLIEDIAKRIAQAGQFTATASYEAWKLQQMGISQRKLKNEIAKRLGVSLKEAEKLLTQAAETGYNFDMSRFPTSQAIPLSANSSLQQILDATVKLAREELTNMTQTMGFVGPDGQCRELTDAYNAACDFAFQKVSAGAQDYQSAIRDATRNLAEKGIRTIDYKSGYHTSIEAAIRQNIMGGMGLMVEQISESNHELLGCDGWEISAHAGSAPDHEPIQGKQYSDKAYKELNDSLVRRIGTLNCGHTAFPIIMGVNSPQYTEEELEEFRQQNEEGVTFEGKHYTLYEATQRQRKFERTIRKQKRRILVDEATGDKDKLQTDQIRLVRLRQEYARFSKGVGLPMQHARMETAGFDWKKGKAAEGVAKAANKNRATGSNKVTEDGDIQQRKTLTPSMKRASTTPAADNAQNVPTQGFVDVTNNWYPEAIPGSHPVVDLQSYTVNGHTYVVDGRNVQLKYSKDEKKIADLLEREVGGEIFMVPRVNNPQGIKTPDYLFHGKGYDLKTLHSPKGKNPIFNRIQNAKGQSRNFILDLTDAGLDEDTVKKQIEKVFTDKGTEFVDEIVVVQDGKIVKVLRRQKKS